MQMKNAVTFFTLIISLSAFSQKGIDYYKISHSIDFIKDTPSMRAIDSSIQKLTTMDTSQIFKALDLYYFDLGMAYYIKYAEKVNAELPTNGYDSLAIFSFEKAISVDKKRSLNYHKSIAGFSHHMLAFIYYSEKNYSLAKTNMDLSKSLMKKKDWDNDLISAIESKQIEHTK